MSKCKIISSQKAVSLLCASVLIAASSDVFARTKTITRSRGGGGFNRSATVTGSQGNTWNRQSQGSWNSETGTWNKSVQRTGANGQTAERNKTMTRMENGYSKTTTAIGRQGNSASRDVQGRWDSETGTWTKNVKVTAKESE